jgi:hypothetical protein
MSTFGEYVDGKTIAIVGPAPAPYDQTAEVDAHDIVYRASYGRSIPSLEVLQSSTAADGRDYFYSGVFPAGYGTRVDMAYYCSGDSDMAARGELDQVLVDLDWAVYKRLNMPVTGLTNSRSANQPPMSSGLQNQITGMLWDLTFYHPQAVTVFGADFYTSPVEEWYDPTYYASEYITDPQQMVTVTNAKLWHNQSEQRRVVKMVRDLGWLVGDDRYLRALDMTFEEHNAILEAQLTRAHRASLV